MLPQGGWAHEFAGSVGGAHGLFTAGCWWEQSRDRLNANCVFVAISGAADQMVKPTDLNK
jgi:hypothetical protein